MEPLKNMFDRPFVGHLTERVSAHYPIFDGGAFKRRIFDRNWSSLKLKQRMRKIATALGEFLPPDFGNAVSILLKVKPELNHGSYLSFTSIVLADFVEVFGLSDLEDAIPALEAFTIGSSSEFAVRPFIVRYPDVMMRQMLVWARHPNEHVRRLASEGCRPRLPWAMALPEFKKDPSPILPILEILKTDPSEYVRRSVANNLNDIAKDHPELVLSLAKQWIGKNIDTDAMIRHALRTLLKKGDTEALSMFGTAGTSGVSVKNLRLSPKRVPIGKPIEIRFRLLNRRKRTLRIEYAVFFIKSGGKISRKIFQIREADVKEGWLEFRKAHSFQDRTTRKHHPGRHRIAIVVNGKILASGFVVLAC